MNEGILDVVPSGNEIQNEEGVDVVLIWHLIMPLEYHVDVYIQ